MPPLRSEMCAHFTGDLLHLTCLSDNFETRSGEEFLDQNAIRIIQTIISRRLRVEHLTASWMCLLYDVYNTQQPDAVLTHDYTVPHTHNICYVTG